MYSTNTTRISFKHVNRKWNKQTHKNRMPKASNGFLFTKHNFGSIWGLLENIYVHTSFIYSFIFSFLKFKQLIRDDGTEFNLKIIWKCGFKRNKGLLQCQQNSIEKLNFLPCIEIEDINLLDQSVCWIRKYFVPIEILIPEYFEWSEMHEQCTNVCKYIASERAAGEEKKDEMIEWPEANYGSDMVLQVKMILAYRRGPYYNDYCIPVCNHQNHSMQLKTGSTI